MDFTDIKYLAWLGISFVLIGVLLFFSLKKKWSFKTATTVMVVFAIVSEFLKLFSHIQGVGQTGDAVWTDYSNGGILLPKSLPLHLCSILIFVEFYLLWGKDQKKIEFFKSFLTPIGITAGLLAVFLATSGTEFYCPDNPWRTVDSYQSFGYHAALVWYALYLYITRQASLGLKDFKRNVLAMFILSIVMIWVNSILKVYDTNFCFVVAPPAKGLPLLNLNNGWHAYFAHLLFAGILLELFVHLRGIIEDVKAKKAFKTEE